MLRNFEHWPFALFFRVIGLNKSRRSGSDSPRIPAGNGAARVPPASTGGHEIMLIKHIEQQNSDVLSYIYMGVVGIIIKYFLAKMQDGRKIRRISGRRLSKFFCQPFL